LLVVDIAWGRVLQIDSAGRFDVMLEYDGAPNGLASTDSGTTVIIADGTRGLIWAEQSDGSLSPTRSLESWQGHPFLGLNDLIVAEDGSILMTDQGMSGLHDPSGRVLHLAPNGEETTLLGGIPSPNGLALRPGLNELLLAVTRDNGIWRVPFDESFKAFRVGRWIQLSGGIGPDGMALGDRGELYVAHLGLGVVWAIDEMGRIVGRFESPGGARVTNVAFSAEERIIYVTEADTGSVLIGNVRDFV
jgi:gluconolactonase